MRRPKVRCLLLVLFSACGRSASITPQSSEYASQSEALTVCASGQELLGVDVSVDQGNINWGQVADAGIKWAYAKATEGTTYQDPVFGQNWSGMKAAGVMRGAYHFFHPGMNGTAQADHFLSYAGAMQPGDLPPMLDWEVTDGVGGGTAAANAQAFINEIQARTGRPTVIYTAPGLWNGFGVPSFGSNPLYVADWAYCYTGGCCPIMPSGWNNWVFWQWSDMGNTPQNIQIPGIPARVDVDVFNGDESALVTFAGGSVAPACNNPIGHGVGHATSMSPNCGGGGPPGLPGVPSACGGIPVNQGLGPGDSVSSCDGRFQLTMQTDGNVVLYAHGIALWSTGTGGTNGYLFVMQGDGNLVLYSSTGCPLWASNTGGNPGASLALQSDGNLVIYNGSSALWSSGTGPIPPAPEFCGSIPIGDGLGPGDSVWACGGCFNLVMQGDGNLVLYQNGGHVIWDTGTNSAQGYALELQGDNNAVLYSSGGCPVWASNTGGSGGTSLAIQDDGNLVIYSGNGAVWASNSVACPGGCACVSPLVMTPTSATVPPRGSTRFSASGGSGGYVWSLPGNSSGGHIDPSGNYTAGATPSVTDTAQVLDSQGRHLTASVNIGPGVTIATPATIAPREKVSLMASGGSGTGFVWSLASPANGSITSAGLYAAPVSGNVTDTVRVVDSLGNTASATVSVGPQVSIEAPANWVPPRGQLALSGKGGNGVYTWELLAAPSGAAVTSAGAYTAGAMGDVTDLVAAVDLLGNSATAEISVGPGVSIEPAQASVNPAGVISFDAVGGSGDGFAWSLTENPSGGSIADGGLYTAGETSGVTDVVHVVDSLGNVATAKVTVETSSSDEGQADAGPDQGGRANARRGCRCGDAGIDAGLLGLLLVLARRRLTASPGRRC